MAQNTEYPAYCSSYLTYERFDTHEVKIGNLKMGRQNPIIVQSMVNTNTMDTEATVQQVIELVNAGCQLVRITAPGVKEAENLRAIKDKLRSLGINVPLVADIHFAPKAADIAATIVEKVRINPGNYVDKKAFKSMVYTDEAYADELQKIEEKLIPFLEICRQHGTAVRIGSNHGSLSDRIVNRYGNTPEGMVEAAMEFLRICQKEKFDNVVVSMKASNTQVMTHSTRLLAAKMKAENMRFPIHLGVTEAGNGDDARVKSAMGIGALLADGIGDTIRVSLTEHPVAEIPVAHVLIEHALASLPTTHFNSLSPKNFSPYQFKKRISQSSGQIGGGQSPVVLTKIDHNVPMPTPADYLWINDSNLAIQPNQKYILPYTKCPKQDHMFPLYTSNEWVEHSSNAQGLVFVLCTTETLAKVVQSKTNAKPVLIAESRSTSSIAEWRSVFFELDSLQCPYPVLLYKSYVDTNELSIKSAYDFGPILIDGFGDGICIDSPQSSEKNNQLAFAILQGSRVRMSKTEFISCPSCGRTLFDLESTTEKIKQRLSHLKELKIGVMGCIVNGPGEMADADYGYVGTGKGTISLYKGQQVVRRNIPEAEAVEELIALIQSNGDWKDA